MAFKKLDITLVPYVINYLNPIYFHKKTLYHRIGRVLQGHIVNPSYLVQKIIAGASSQAQWHVSTWTCNSKRLSLPRRLTFGVRELFSP